MDFRYNRPIRIISLVTLLFFCWTFGGIFDIVAFAATDSKQTAGSSKQLTSQSSSQTQPKPQKPEEKFQRTIEDIEKILAETSTDTDTKKNKLKGKNAEIEGLDTSIKKQFSDTERFLKEKGLSQEILERHYKFVKHYEDNVKELNNNLDAIDKSKTKSEADAALSRAKAHLEKVKAPSKHQKIDPNKLPHRSAEPVWIEPRTSPEQFLKESPKAQVASLKSKTIPEARQIPLSPPLLKWDFTGGSASEKSPTLAKGGKGGFSNNDPVLVASNGSLHGLINEKATPPYSSPYQGEDGRGGTMLIALADPPTSADLAETIEVKFTPAIQAKATELNHNPVKIYNWVRNNIEFIPTYGSIQGADMCLQTKQCNAFDTASLLIALLRVSGIHAKYVYGTIELPIEKVKNWVGGFTDTNSAMTLIASGGIPVTGLTSGGKIEMVRMEHVWAEVFIGYGPYSGRPSNLNSAKTWIPLDPSFKQYTYTEGIDLKTSVPFDTQSFLNQIQSTATINEGEGYVTNIDSNYIQATLTDYRNQVQNYINQNIPNATVEDIIGKKEIVKQEIGILPATLPYKTIVTGAKYSAIPDNLRHKVTFTIIDPYLFETSLSYTASIPEFVGKRLTLSYAPATSTDQQIIDSYGSIYNVPAYLVNMKPQIKVEGIVKIVGSSMGIGKQQTFKMTFIGPNINTDVISNNVTTGAYYGIGISPNKIPKELIEKRGMKLESVKNTLNQNNIYTDDYIGELLYTTAMLYFFELDSFDAIFASSYEIADVKYGAEGMVVKDLKVSYSFGVPLKVDEGNMVIDIDRNIHIPISRSGGKPESQRFMLMSGQTSSAVEHGIFEQLYQAKGVSTVKLLEEASNQGIPIYSINQGNVYAVLPMLTIPNEVKMEIQNAVNAGKNVVVPKQSISYYGWTGVGYVVLDPHTGAGAYMISANLAGGGECIGAGGCSLGDYWEIFISPLEKLLAIVAIFAIPATAIVFSILVIGIEGFFMALGLVLAGIGIGLLIAVLGILIVLGLGYLIKWLFAGVDTRRRRYVFKGEFQWAT